MTHATFIAGAIVTASLRRLALWTAVGVAVVMTTANAQQPVPTVQLTISNHRFSPSEIRIAAGKPIFLEIVNQDGEPEEFEMRQLAIEKVIPAGGKGKVRLRPLGPGRYVFIGEFHQDTAQGAVIAE
jgi:uncharacterized cupredoxin-like copper-binding protein